MTSAVISGPPEQGQLVQVRSRRWIVNEVKPSTLPPPALNRSGLVHGTQIEIFTCSSMETVSIPSGYFGVVQTKGSLARLFVQIHCCEGQVEPGFSGTVTFEVINHAPFPVRLKPGQEVAQLFLLKTSTKHGPLYDGRYQHATGPTLHRGIAR